MSADLVAPRHLSIPDGYDERRTLGPEVAAVATLAGFPPDPEQRLCLDVSFALNKRGQPLVFDSTVIAPRQNLKTGFLKQRALGKLFVLQRPLVVWSAHEFDTSRNALLDLEAMIDASDALRRQVALTARGKVARHGAVPEITLRSGARLVFKTRTSGGGRGLSGDDLFVDEAFAAQAEQMGAVVPILLARPGSQVDFTSSACRPESAYLWDRVQQGRAGAGPRSFYVEWCTPPPTEACDAGDACQHHRGAVGCGCDKPEVIRLAHSAVTRGRITLEKITDLRRTLPPEEYGREVMGWHDKPVGGTSALDLVAWAAGADHGSQPLDPVALGIDVRLDETAACIAASGKRPDGLRHGEITGRLSRGEWQLDARPGTAWVVDRLREIAAAARPCVLVIDPTGPAGALLPDLAATGFVKVTSPADRVPAGKWPLYAITAREYAQACGALAGEIRAGQWRHLDQRPLDDAAVGARTRLLADAYAWSRKDSGVDISPLVAVTLARHGHVLFGDGRRNAGKGRVIALR